VDRKVLILPKGSSRFILEDFEKFFGITYLDTPRFVSEQFRHKVQGNVPWLLQHTVFGYEQRRLGASLRLRLLQGFVEDVSIRWIDDVKGYGLFAERDFEPHTYIGEYVGEIRQIKRFKADLNGYCMHYPSAFFSYNYFVIDAAKAGNVTRFINHSESANLRPFSVLDKKLLHVVFYTTCKILQGEELTFNYGKDYWRKRALTLCQ
jgi:hypothetical protein